MHKLAKFNILRTMFVLLTYLCSEETSCKLEMSRDRKALPVIQLFLLFLQPAEMRSWACELVHVCDEGVIEWEDTCEGGIRTIAYGCESEEMVCY